MAIQVLSIITQYMYFPVRNRLIITMNFAIQIKEMYYIVVSGEIKYNQEDIFYPGLKVQYLPSKVGNYDNNIDGSL